MVLLKKLQKSCFDEFFFSEREFLVFPHCALCLIFKYFVKLFYIFGKKRNQKKKKNSVNSPFLEVRNGSDRFESKKRKNDRFSLIKKYFVKSTL